MLLCAKRFANGAACHAGRRVSTAEKTREIAGLCGHGGIGRRATLRSLWAKARGSSSLLDRTSPAAAGCRPAIPTPADPRCRRPPLERIARVQWPVQPGVAVLEQLGGDPMDQTESIRAQPVAGLDREHVDKAAGLRDRWNRDRRARHGRCRTARTSRYRAARTRHSRGRSSGGTAACPSNPANERHRRCGSRRSAWGRLRGAGRATDRWSPKDAVWYAPTLTAKSRCCAG